MTPAKARDRLFREILMARQRVYEVATPTPLERLELPLDAEVFVKREDLSPIHAYKWRGAYNRMASLGAAERERGVVAASAGNHAQGVALAARTLGTRAHIFMPTSTPRMKQSEVARHGGGAVEIVLTGDSYSDAAAAAHQACVQSGATLVHPYDDLGTMAGQGTLADEAVMAGAGPFDAVYLQIGGGGMAAAVACWLKAYFPRLQAVGVEGIDQASMQAAIAAGHPVDLPYVDVFCDGTAVRRAGDNTFPLCRHLIDQFLTVTNDEVCAAIQYVWEALRIVPEPSGAMGIAGLLQDADTLKGQRILTVLCGANMDFGQLATIARHAGIGAHRRRYFRITLPERQGALVELLDTLFTEVNIIEFQHGKTDPTHAWPVIGVEAAPPVLDALERGLESHGYAYQTVTSEEDVEFRIINYDPHLFQRPYFIKVEFPERAGALHDFLLNLHGIAGICYFNYVFTGETVGRALIGFEFESDENRMQARQIIAHAGLTCREIDSDILGRIL